MLFIDANLFLAHDNARDVHHTRAVELWQEMEAGAHGLLFTTDYILNEVAGGTFWKFGKERAVKIGKQIFEGVSILTIDEHMLQEAWKIFVKTDSGLNLVDCTNLVALTVANTDTIATFDQGFKNFTNVIS